MSLSLLSSGLVLRISSWALTLITHDPHLLQVWGDRFFPFSSSCFIRLSSVFQARRSGPAERGVCSRCVWSVWLPETGCADSVSLILTMWGCLVRRWPLFLRESLSCRNMEGRCWFLEGFGNCGNSRIGLFLSFWAWNFLLTRNSAGRLALLFQE